MTTNQLFSQVIDACPAWRVQTDEHLLDNDEILPNVLMSDLGRLVAGYFTGSTNLEIGPPTETELRAILAILDAALAIGDEATANTVAVSFVEHLWGEPYYEELLPYLGLNTRAEIKRMKPWYQENG